MHIFGISKRNVEKCWTAGRLGFLRPCPAAGRLVTSLQKKSKYYLLCKIEGTMTADEAFAEAKNFVNITTKFKQLDDAIFSNHEGLAWNYGKGVWN